MTTTFCICATLLALLTIPVIVLLHATESTTQRQTRRCKRLKSKGYSQRAIARELGISQSTVCRRLAFA
jgi:DNA-binding NarL/FixJ family response regulator